jgi:hypothetical protein
MCVRYGHMRDWFSPDVKDGQKVVISRLFFDSPEERLDVVSSLIQGGVEPVLIFDKLGIDHPDPEVDPYADFDVPPWYEKAFLNAVKREFHETIWKLAMADGEDPRRPDVYSKYTPVAFRKLPPGVQGVVIKMLGGMDDISPYGDLS